MTKLSVLTKENDFTIKDLLRDRIYRTNLIVMVMAWIASSFCFYILGFYVKYIPGDIFVNTIIISFSDASSAVSAGYAADFIGTR